MQQRNFLTFSRSSQKFTAKTESSSLFPVDRWRYAHRFNTLSPSEPTVRHPVAVLIICVACWLYGKTLLFLLFFFSLQTPLSLCVFWLSLMTTVFTPSSLGIGGGWQTLTLIYCHLLGSIFNCRNFLPTNIPFTCSKEKKRRRKK